MFTSVFIYYYLEFDKLMILFYYGWREDLICIERVSWMGLIFGLLSGFGMGLGSLGGCGLIASFSDLVMS